MSKVVTRFAPSPTGYLHLGHAFAAFQAFDYANTHNGTCLLRIEDIDHTRCRPDYTQAIFEDLRWLGFMWSDPVRIQSKHMPDYDNVIRVLETRKLVYRCFKQRRELPDGVFRGEPDPDEAKKLAKREPFAWRLCMNTVETQLTSPLFYKETGFRTEAVTINLSLISDPILARKDIGTSFLLACTHDDQAQNITHVVRGKDMAEFTSVQTVLQRLMGWSTPVYHHHALVLGADGNKLSKRNLDTTIKSLREQGLSPDKVMAMAGL